MTYTEANVIISPESYDPDRTCVYTITNPTDCIALTFLSFNIPQGPDDDMCTTDFVKVSVFSLLSSPLPSHPLFVFDV